MLHFWRFFTQKKSLTPSIINKRIFEFLISRIADILLINKWWISGNTNISGRLKMVKIWYPTKIFKFFLNKKINFLIWRIKRGWISLSDKYPKKIQTSVGWIWICLKNQINKLYVKYWIYNYWKYVISMIFQFI